MKTVALCLPLYVSVCLFVCPSVYVCMSLSVKKGKTKEPNGQKSFIFRSISFNVSMNSIELNQLKIVILNFFAEVHSLSKFKSSGTKGSWIRWGIINYHSRIIIKSHKNFSDIKRHSSSSSFKIMMFIVIAFKTKVAIFVVCD